MRKSRYSDEQIAAALRQAEVEAVSRGGAKLESHNHVTACTPCNELKGNRSGWIPGAIHKDEWDGLVSLYRPLAKRLENVRQYHNDWFRDLKI